MINVIVYIHGGENQSFSVKSTGDEGVRPAHANEKKSGRRDKGAF